ncbi:low temperature requirement protein A [Paenibacillus sedimenti]|uniref:Low temperature requirement protein A n=1 Tax=Paenibacillus sedimenti TaxID=2770274 RepID=A0A926KVG3_9BACL|nr:low temperature requirement protein A [Paenibacillus sedimenti]MBD0384780.1 low temperature requirement protein A [Paenibacillus sedimenti]
MAERCGLFIIIALGESILVTRVTFSKLAWNVETMLAFLISFGGTVAMWWIYFEMTSKIGHYFLVHSSDPGRLASHATGLAAVAILGLFASAMSPLILAAASLIILVAVSIWGSTLSKQLSTLFPDHP